MWSIDRQLICTCSHLLREHPSISSNDDSLPFGQTFGVGVRHPLGAFKGQRKSPFSVASVGLLQKLLYFVALRLGIPSDSSNLNYKTARSEKRLNSSRIAIGVRDLSRDMAAMKTVSIDRAAEILQVSRRTIYNHIRRGYLQTIRTIGGQSQRVTLESLALVQGTGRRRGERFFVAERHGDTTRIPESIETQHHVVNDPAATPAPDVVNHLNDRSLEFLSRPSRLRSAQDVVETANQQLRVLRGHLRDVSKVLRGDIGGR